MKTFAAAAFVSLSVLTQPVSILAAGEPVTPAPAIPRFSIDYMDRSVKPGDNFYLFADGQWVKDNPVPADKAAWGSFSALAEYNGYLIHQILMDAAADKSAPKNSPRRQVGDFYASAMDTNRIEKLGIQPIKDDLKRIAKIETTKDLFTTLAYLHNQGVGGMFDMGFDPDEKNSSVYVVDVGQGGLSLPDRDYYLKESFADTRKKYRAHVQKMFVLLGETPEDAAAHAATVLSIESELAKASRTRVELRDPDKNYNKFTTADWFATNAELPWKVYFKERGIAEPEYQIVDQPEFFTALDKLVRDRPIADWQTYLRWHVLNSAAPYLSQAFVLEHFDFFGRTLSGQPQLTPRWKRAMRVIDGSIGEALGQLYVEKYFPPDAKARMNDLVNNLKAVYHDRIERVPWMTDATREKALAKFARFTQKIGYPDKFRDYSSVKISRDDFVGNIRRAEMFESKREIARIGKPVDRTEWDMTPETVNAYFNPLQNEIVFPAGILQPPFFDITMDDAVNYGGIGAVIGHEMTHGYDDEGRQFDADGNLNDWWSPADAKAFNDRAQLVVDEYNGFEALPGLHVNGKLTLGENLADLGGVNIAYEALQRALAKDPSQRKTIDGFTPEQRFFISFAQLYRSNIREAAARQYLTVDGHSPDRFRAYGPLLNLQEFYDAFDIQPGSPMWIPPDKRAKIW
jgi:putative endopeptidase